jgi:hypothetical protein
MMSPYGNVLACRLSETSESYDCTGHDFQLKLNSPHANYHNGVHFADLDHARWRSHEIMLVICPETQTRHM